MYLDTSIIIKLLVPEHDSGFFEKATFDQPLTTSELAFTEVAAALQAKQRAGSFTEQVRHKAWAAFLEWTDQDFLALHPLNHRTLTNANRIINGTSVPIRTIDAIHVSACDLSQDFPLCTTDRRMREAAAAFGIPVFPESLPQP